MDRYYQTTDNLGKSGRELPGEGEGKRGPSGHIAYLLRQANAAVRRSLEARLEPLGLTQPQFAVLTMLHAYGELTGAELARLAALTPQTVHLITTNLLKRGLLRAGDRQGRFFKISIEPEGARILAAAKQHATALEDELVSTLSDEAEDQVRLWLSDVAKTLRQPDE